MPDIAIINGEQMPLEQATVSVLDLGFLRGVGAFETLRTYGGHPHSLGEHLNRLTHAGESLGIPQVLMEASFRPKLAAAIKASGHPEVRINLIVTPGIHTSGVFGADKPTWVAIIRKLVEPPKEWYTRGVPCITFRGARVCPEFKTTTYITGREGLLAAEKRKAHEAIYVNEDEEVSEGVTSNVLVLKGGTVTSPAADNLPGITRAGIEPIARAAGLDWRVARVTIQDLYDADEIWLTSAVRELVPVVTVNGRPIGDGRPGPWSERIRERYRERCETASARHAANP